MAFRNRSGQGHLLPLLPLVLAAFVPTLALAKAPQQLAVLEFRGSGVPQNLLRTLADAARAGAFRSVEGGKLAVMTRETVADLLDDADLEGCTEGECEVETGQELGADYLVTGEVSVVDGGFVSTVKIYEIGKERLLGLDVIRASNQLVLMDEVEKRVTVMLSGAFERSEQMNRAADLAKKEEHVDRRAVEIANKDNGSWFFQTKSDGPITENEFVRRFAKTTGRSDANRFEQDRSGGRVGLGIVITAVGAGGMVYGFSQPVYDVCVTCPSGLAVNPAYIWPISLGVSLTAIGILATVGNLMNPDGLTTEHSMSRDDAERLIRLHNEALDSEPGPSPSAPSSARSEKRAPSWSFAAGPNGIGVSGTF